MDEPTPAAVAEWRDANTAGWKRAAKHFGVPVARLHVICEHTPRGRARACASCDALREQVAKLQRATTAEERVRGSRVEFLRIQLVQALGDLDDLRGQERTGTAISVQTRTVAELRVQLDDEEHRLLEASGDPIEQMSADELVADIAEVIRELPDMLHDQIAAVVLERYGQEPELLLG